MSKVAVPTPMLPESKVNIEDEKLSVLNPAIFVNTLLTEVLPLPTVEIPIDVFKRSLSSKLATWYTQSKKDVVAPTFRLVSVDPLVSRVPNALSIWSAQPEPGETLRPIESSSL